MGCGSSVPAAGTSAVCAEQPSLTTSSSGDLHNVDRREIFQEETLDGAGCHNQQGTLADHQQNQAEAAKAPPSGDSGDVHGHAARHADAAAIFQKFDLNSDGKIDPWELERDIFHLGLACPLRHNPEDAVSELRTVLNIGLEDSVTVKHFQEHFEDLKNRLSATGIDYAKADIIQNAVMWELKQRGCLLADGEQPAADDAAVDSRAVSLEVLLALHTALGTVGDYDLPTLSFAVRCICTAKTGEQLRFFSLLSPKHVGRPTAFVSHMWHSPEPPFRFTARAVLDHFQAQQLSPQQRASTHLWVDLFAISQHPGTGQKDDFAGLESAVGAAAQGTLFVLDKAGQALTRIWCLLEIWRTAELGKNLTILTSSLDGKALSRVYKELDVGKAEATLAVDRDRILDRIRCSSLNIPMLNQKIKEALLASTADEVRRNEGRSTGEAIRSFHKHGRLLHYCLQDLAGAEAMLRRAVEGHEAELGPDHDDTLACIQSLANVLRARGDLDGAEAMHRRVLAATEAKRGTDHADRMGSLNDLATLMYTRGDLGGAEQMARRSLSGTEATFGGSHTATISRLSSLAILLSDQGNMAGAEEMLRRALAGCEAKVGANHMRTLMAVENLASLLERRGNLDGAERLYRRALEGYEAMLGADHATTLSSSSKLGFLLRARGDLDGAEAMHRRALAGHEAKLGARHADTLTAMNDLAMVLHARGDLDAAEQMLRRCLAGREATPGAGSSKLRCVLANLATVLEARGDAGGLEELNNQFKDVFQQAVEAE